MIIISCPLRSMAESSHTLELRRAGMRSSARRSTRAQSAAARSINFVADVEPSWEPSSHAMEAPAVVAAPPFLPARHVAEPHVASSAAAAAAHAAATHAAHAAATHAAPPKPSGSGSPRVNLASAFDHARESEERERSPPLPAEAPTAAPPPPPPPSTAQPSVPKFTLGSLPSFTTTPRRRALTKGKHSPGRTAGLAAAATAAGSYPPTQTPSAAPRPPVAPAPTPVAVRGGAPAPSATARLASAGIFLPQQQQQAALGAAAARATAPSFSFVAPAPQRPFVAPPSRNVSDLPPGPPSASWAAPPVAKPATAQAGPTGALGETSQPRWSDKWNHSAAASATGGGQPGAAATAGLSFSLGSAGDSPDSPLGAAAAFVTGKAGCNASS